MLCAREDLVDSLELLQFMRSDSGHKEVRFSVLLPGTGERKRLYQQMQKPEAEQDKALIRFLSKGLNDAPQLARQLLNHSSMPHDMRHDQVSERLQELFKESEVTLGLPLNFDAGLDWTQIKGIACMHFQGSSFRIHARGSPNAFTLARFGNGDLMEPVMRVLHNLLGSAVCDGLLPAETNVAFMNACALILGAECGGFLPKDTPPAVADEVWKKANTHRNIVLARLSIAMLNEKFPEGQRFDPPDLDEMAICLVTQGEDHHAVARFAQQLKDHKVTGVDMVVPIQVFSLAKSPSMKSLASAVDRFGTICGIKVLNLLEPRAPHLQGLSSAFKHKAFLKMPDDNRKRVGQAMARFCDAITGQTTDVSAQDGYVLSYLSAKRITPDEEEFVQAANKRASFSKLGFQLGADSNFRQPGEDKGTKKGDPRITQNQHEEAQKARYTADAIANGAAGVFWGPGEKAGPKPTGKHLSREQYEGRRVALDRDKSTSNALKLDKVVSTPRQSTAQGITKDLGPLANANDESTRAAALRAHTRSKRHQLPKGPPLAGQQVGFRIGRAVGKGTSKRQAARNQDRANLEETQCPGCGRLFSYDNRAKVMKRHFASTPTCDKAAMDLAAKPLPSPIWHANPKDPFNKLWAACPLASYLKCTVAGAEQVAQRRT